MLYYRTWSVIVIVRSAIYINNDGRRHVYQLKPNMENNENAKRTDTHPRISSPRATSAEEMLRYFSWWYLELLSKSANNEEDNDGDFDISSAVKKRKEGNYLFNDALNTFYLRLYGVTHMVKDHSESERGNSLPPHGLLFPISSKGSFICTIPQTG